MELINDALNLSKREKMLLVTVIMFAGKMGLDEFEKEMNNKISERNLGCRMSKQSMVNVMRKCGMPDYMIDTALFNIFADDGIVRKV